MRNLLVILWCFVLAGCDTGATYRSNANENIHILNVKGKPIECIRQGHRLSCNWEKWNEQRD